MALGTMKRTTAPPPVVDDDSGRPPSVSPDLWRAVPDRLREEAVRRAARDLRRSVHPETSISAFLKENNLPTRVPKPASVNSTSTVGAAPVRTGGLRRRTASISSESAIVSPPEAPSPPLSLSELLLREMGGRPAAAAAEREILSAVKRDPVMGSDPIGLLSMGVRVPAMVLQTVADAIRVEAEQVVVQFRERKAAGDPALAEWVDPDDWSFNPDDSDCHRSPSV